jgi:hypothetical protein
MGMAMESWKGVLATPMTGVRSWRAWWRCAPRPGWSGEVRWTWPSMMRRVAWEMGRWGDGEMGRWGGGEMSDVRCQLSVVSCQWGRQNV